VLTEMAELTEAGCVGFSQAEVPLANTQVLQRALQYASTFGYTVWLRPQELWLGKGVAASGPLATRMGLSGVPVAAETIALHTIIELMRATGARVHLCRISSAAGVAWCARPRPKACRDGDVSINSLHLTDTDIGYFDSRARLNPPLRQQRDRDALRAALADGTIDALVSDHTPVDEDAKTLPFAEASPAPPGWSCCWAGAQVGPGRAASPARALAVLTSEPRARAGQRPGHAAGQRRASWWKAAWPTCACSTRRPPGRCRPTDLRSQGKHTPFSGYELPGGCAARWWAGSRVRGLTRPGLNEITGARLLALLRAWWHALRAGHHRCGVSAPVARPAQHARAGLGAPDAGGAGHRPAIAARRPVNGPVLLVANHISWLDIVVLHAARHCRFVSKAMCKRWPLIGTLATGAGTLYIERESRRDAMRVVHHMADALQAGDILAVFPEGTTSDGISLLPFHANLIQAAVSAGAPVQPVALRFIDAHRPDQPGALLHRRRHPGGLASGAP
jgi:1-acyl-sn-glycerol-3-phosphate acyltransferase